jgi:hypothetical protein
MTSRQVVTVIFSVLFVTSANAFAQVKSGLNEVSFSATVAGSKFEGGDTTTGATLTGSYGRFLSDTIEVGPQLIFFKSEGSDAFGTINGFAAYHLNPSSRVVPFAGGQIGRSYGLSTDFTDNPWDFGFFGGIKAFLGESGAVTVQPFWTRQSMHETVFDTTSHMYTFGVSAGISIFWG